MKIGALEAGGTKMVCAVGNEKGQVEDRVSIPTATPRETIPRLTAYFENKGIDALGIACFGPVCLDRTKEKYGSITSTPKLPWRDFPFAETMKKVLRCPVGFDTDVNASVLGEVTYGCGRGLENVCYLTVGTGIGLGVWTEGKLLHGNQHPEAGHLKIRRHPADSYRGHCPYHGDCLEGLASGPALAERWGMPAERLSDKEEVWDMEAYYLAQAVSSYILILAPQKIILGGGVLHQESLLPKIRKYVRKEINGYLQTEEMSDLGNYIVKYSLGDNQGILGCLELGKRAR